MVHYGKFIVVHHTDNLEYTKNTAVVVLADAVNPNQMYTSMPVLYTSEHDFKTYLAMESATRRFKKVYVCGVNALEFMIFCIMVSLYKLHNPRSLYVVRRIVRNIAHTLPHASTISIARLIKMELQLKISLLYI